MYNRNGMQEKEGDRKQKPRLVLRMADKKVSKQEEHLPGKQNSLIKNFPFIQYAQVYGKKQAERMPPCFQIVVAQATENEYIYRPSAPQWYRQLLRW